MNTREDWLNQALHLCLAHICAQAPDSVVPQHIRVSCGFPAGNARKAIGQCWGQTASADGAIEIFISPVLADPSGKAGVLAVLVHEAIHAVVGVKHGHKAPFKRVAIAIGLEGKMTATTANQRLQTTFLDWIAQLGTYPHATLSPDALGGKKQSTRLVKCECSGCGYIARTTAKWIKVSGAPLCPGCTDEDGERLQMVAVETKEGEAE